VVQAAVAVQQNGRSHKLNLRLRAHWGCHDLTALKPPEVLLQPWTAADDPAIQPKRNYPRLKSEISNQIFGK
jgi:hypothetical protein